MGGDGSQKLRPWRGIALLSGAQQTSGSLQNQKFSSKPSAPVRFAPAPRSWASKIWACFSSRRLHAHAAFSLCTSQHKLASTPTTECFRAQVWG
jgi:hypothetical protein